MRKRAMAVAAIALCICAALATPALTRTYYRIRSGDTLSDIGDRYGHSAAAIAAVNRIDNPDVIHVGDRLIVDDWGDARAIRRRIRNYEPDTTAARQGGSSTGSSMPCPVAGPVSFTDSFGAARSGHAHEGVDMMADYGTPVVAVVSGTITYAAYDESGGNMLILSGEDGNDYYYIHNQENLVSGGQVSAGQQIATVGDTGNAAGTPHLHFEYHPGGGGAVNPTGLASSLC